MSQGALLRVVAAAGAEIRGMEFTVPPGRRVSIGRADQCDLVLQDASVSGLHALLEIEADGSLHVVDQNSTNHVYIQGKKITDGKVLPGKQFTLGQVALLLVASESSFSPSQSMAQTYVAEGEFQGEDAVLFGEKIVTSANQEFLLTDPARVWILESGRIDLFTAATDGDKVVGGRHYLTSVNEGGIFMGIDTMNSNIDEDVLAVAKRADSELITLDLDQLQQRALSPAYRRQISDQIEDWLTGLSKALAQRISKEEIPTTTADLETGRNFIFRPNKALIAEELLWIRMPPGRFLWNASGMLGEEVADLYFPVTPGSWVEILGPVREKWEIVPKLTEEVISDPRMWSGLGHFHRVFCECLALYQDLGGVDLYQQDIDRAVHSNEARDVGKKAINAVILGEEYQEPLIPDAAAGDMAALQAAQRVARHMGIPINPHPDSITGGGLRQSLLQISAASGFRIRKIKLGDQWWRHDQGPFVGEVEGDQKAGVSRPTAVLPTGPGSYVCVGDNGQETAVDEDFAAKVAGFGYVFYRPLPRKKLERRDFLKFALRDLGPEIKMLLLMGFGLGSLSTVTPMLTGMIFDDAIPQAEHGLLYQFALGLFVVALMGSAFEITQKIALLRIQGKFDYAAQAAVWDRLLNLPMRFFRDFDAGDLADRAAGVAKIRAAIAGIGVSAILGSLASTFNLIQMGLYSFRLAGIALLLTLTYIALIFFFGVFQVRYQRQELKEQGRVRSLVFQLISGVNKLRVSGAENHAFRIWTDYFVAQRRKSFLVGQVGNAVMVLNSGFTLVSTLVIFAMMAHLQTAETEGASFEMTTGDFLAFNAAFGIFIAAMQKLGGASVDLLKILPTFERMEPILKAEPEISEEKSPPGKLQGKIEVRNLRFRYTEGGPLILQDVSLTIQEGQFVAFVGGSGSGKSTLMKILLGLEKPNMGMVYYDNQAIESLDLRLLRQQLGVVLQDSRILPASIFLNIVGSHPRTRREAMEAAKKAGLARDINRMPMKMDTLLSEGGGGLSGGQRQRLMIARALVGNPKIVFLDEATSALDNETQAIVTRSMEEMDITRIVIAHRISTIRDADCIYYLEKGKIKESGTFDELLQKPDGAFAALARRQMG